MTLRDTAAAICLLALATLTGCPGKADTEEATYTDEGTACLDAPEADGAAVVTVDPQVCLSSSCDTLTFSDCSVTVINDTITVTSTFVVVTEGDTCTDDCGMPTATCDAGALAAGTYTLVYGGAETTVTVPTTEGCSAY